MVNYKLILLAASKGTSNRVTGQAIMDGVGVYGSNPNLASNNQNKIDLQSKSL